MVVFQPATYHPDVKLKVREKSVEGQGDAGNWTALLHGGRVRGKIEISFKVEKGANSESWSFGMADDTARKANCNKALGEFPDSWAIQSDGTLLVSECSKHAKSCGSKLPPPWNTFCKGDDELFPVETVGTVVWEVDKTLEPDKEGGEPGTANVSGDKLCELASGDKEITVVVDSMDIPANVCGFEVSMLMLTCVPGIKNNNRSMAIIVDGKVIQRFRNIPEGWLFGFSGVDDQHKFILTK
jgi:hypothetical protein